MTQTTMSRQVRRQLSRINRNVPSAYVGNAKALRAFRTNLYTPNGKREVARRLG
jgi:hypothetical protein